MTYFITSYAVLIKRRQENITSFYGLPINNDSPIISNISDSPQPQLLPLATVDSRIATKKEEFCERLSMTCPDPVNNPNMIVMDVKQYRVVTVPGDGSCLFHCLSKLLEKNDPGQQVVRNIIANYLETNRKEFESLLEQPFDEYVNGVRLKAWGTEFEIRAAELIYGRTILVFDINGIMRRIINFEEMLRTGSAPIILRFQDHFQGCEHYDYFQKL